MTVGPSRRLRRACLILSRQFGDEHARDFHPIRYPILCGVLLIVAIAAGTAIMVGNFRARALAGTERELEYRALIPPDRSSARGSRAGPTKPNGEDKVLGMIRARAMRVSCPARPCIWC